MTAQDINSRFVYSYVGLLDNLSTNNKLDLISKLTVSVKSYLTNKKSSFKRRLELLTQKKCRGFIDEIRSNRLSTMQFKSFEKISH